MMDTVDSTVKTVGKRPRGARRKFHRTPRVANAATTGGEAGILTQVCGVRRRDIPVSSSGTLKWNTSSPSCSARVSR